MCVFNLSAMSSNAGKQISLAIGSSAVRKPRTIIKIGVFLTRSALICSISMQCVKLSLTKVFNSCEALYHCDNCQKIKCYLIN